MSVICTVKNFEMSSTCELLVFAVFWAPREECNTISDPQGGSDTVLHSMRNKAGVDAAAQRDFLQDRSGIGRAKDEASGSERA